MNTDHLNLQRLATLRLIAIGVLAACAIYWHSFLNNPLPLEPISIVLTCWAIISLFSLKRNAKHPQQHLLLQLASDIILLTLLLYYTGGATNPFVSFYLVPLAIAAASLPAHKAWAVSAVTLICYSPLLFYYQPLPGMAPGEHDMHQMHQNTDSSGFSLHVLGMWLNYLLSALFISFFLIKMKQTLDAQQALLQKNKEKAIQDGQLMAIATQAAGAAHELGTPLSTMAVIVEELKQSTPEQQEFLELLESQIGLCKNKLQDLVSSSHQQQQADIKDFLQQLIQHWKLLRPQQSIKVSWPEHSQPSTIHYHPSLQQALINLLNNAADAGAQAPELRLDWDDNNLIWQLKDFGPGIDPELHPLLGKQPVKSAKGLGIGLYLSRASIEQQGGTLSWQPQTEGTLTAVTLPLRQQAGARI